MYQLAARALSPRGLARSFCSRVKALEQEAEQLEQTMLERWGDERLPEWSNIPAPIAVEKT